MVMATTQDFYQRLKLCIVSYEEMMEMSALGAGVLETRSVELAKNYNIPLYLGKTLSNVKGTWIMSNERNIREKSSYWCGFG